MKKLVILLFAAIAMLACGSGERGYLKFHGLSMGMSAAEMNDSLTARGLHPDTLHTLDDRYVLQNDYRNYSVLIQHHNDTITDILETYRATYNDSTSRLWQRLHDQYQKDLNQLPQMTYRADLHKEAVYDNREGTLVLTLKNNNQPTLFVRYSTATKHQ